MNARIPCINPRCRRTAPAANYPDSEEVVCGKCWRSLPEEVRARHRTLIKRERRLFRLVERRLARGDIAPSTIERVRSAVFRSLEAHWADVKRRFAAPEAPAGLENFLREVGL